mmetsp:Transcript_15313/g.37564  ORF Transcript_15313/g.37564 Transcript_15313/m.37564 type:complete len:165 (+) Transcript_15313:484-978(+)
MVFFAAVVESMNPPNASPPKTPVVTSLGFLRFAIRLYPIAASPPKSAPEPIPIIPSIQIFLRAFISSNRSSLESLPPSLVAFGVPASFMRGFMVRQFVGRWQSYRLRALLSFVRSIDRSIDRSIRPSVSSLVRSFVRSIDRRRTPLNAPLSFDEGGEATNVSVV